MSAFCCYRTTFRPYMMHTPAVGRVAKLSADETGILIIVGSSCAGHPLKLSNTTCLCLPAVLETVKSCLADGTFP